MSLLNDILTEKMMCCQGQVEAQFIAPCASKNAYSLVENTLSGVSSRKSNTGSRYMNEENIARTTDPATAHLPLVVGVDLGGTQVRVAVLRGARLLARVSWLTGEDPTPEGVISHIMRGIRQVLNEAKVTLDQLAGIGIGVPGPVNCHSGIVFSPPNLLGWDEVPVRDIFSQEFKMPVFVENDANAAALAEYMFGAGRALGMGLVNVIHNFNPQIIILGGSVVQIGELLLEPARRTIEERAIKLLHETTRIVMAELGPDAGLVGAGALIYYYKRQ